MSGVSRKFGFSLTVLLFAAYVLTIHNFFGAPGPPRPVVRFSDVAEKAGIGLSMVNGGAETKKYIFESTGSGVALIDYDRDGYPDIFSVNGSRLEGFGRKARHPPTISSTITATGPSRMSVPERVLRVPVGARACALAISITMVSTICSSHTTAARISFTVIMVTALLQT